MTNATTTKALFYNGVRINSAIAGTTGLAQEPVYSIDDVEQNEDETATTPQPIVTTKRLSLVQDFINQVWYGLIEIKAWHKKYGVYIIDLAPVTGTKCDPIDFMRSWMEVHARFELQDQCYH